MLYGSPSRQGTFGGIGMGNFIPLKKGQTAEQFWSTFNLGDDSNAEGSKYFFKDNIFATQVYVLPDDFDFVIHSDLQSPGSPTEYHVSHVNMIKTLDYAIGDLLGLESLNATKASEIGFDRTVNIFSKFRDNFRFGLYKVGASEWQSTLKYRKMLGFITEEQFNQERNSITDANPLYFWWIPTVYDYYIKSNHASITVSTPPHGMASNTFKEPTNGYRSGSYLCGEDLIDGWLCHVSLYFPKGMLATLGHFESHYDVMFKGDSNLCTYHPGDRKYQGIGSVALDNSNIPDTIPTEWQDVSTLAFDNKILKFMNYGSLMAAPYLAPRTKHITPWSADIIASRCKSAALGFKYLKSSSGSGFENARMDVDFNAIDDIQNVALNLGVYLDPDAISQALLQLERISFVPDEWTCEGTSYTGSGTRDTLCEIFRKCNLYASRSVQSIPIGDIGVDLVCSNGSVVMTVTTRDGTTITIRNQMDGVKNCEYSNDGTIIFCVYYLSVGASLIGTLIDITEEAVFNKNISLSPYIRPTTLDFDKSGLNLCTSSAYRIRKFLTKL